MPRKPKHPCSYPGCPRLVESGERYCTEHARIAAKHYELYERDPAARKRYNAEWRRIRERYVAAHPLCERCLKEGRYTPAEHVHHILPLSEGGTNDEANLMAVCRSCHSKIHAARGDSWKRHRRQESGMNEK